MSRKGVCHGRARDLAGATFREGFPEAGTFWLRSGEKSLPVRGSGMFKGPAASTGWQVGRLSRTACQAGVQREGGSLGQEEAEGGGRAAPCQGHGDRVEASGVS